MKYTSALLLLVLLILLILLTLSPTAAGDAKPVWLVVGPPGLTEAVAPLAAFRAGEGFDVRIAAPPVALAIAALGRDPAFVLIVGDFEAGQDTEEWQVAPMTRPLYRWRPPQRKTFSTDSLYGDSYGDLRPDFPVGRIPARTAAQVAAVVTKTLEFERRIPTTSDLRMLAWAGAPGYGGVIDSMATGLLVSTVRKFAPKSLDRYLISSLAGNPLCGWPPDQPATFNREWRSGAVLAAIVAHAGPRSVFAMRHGDGAVRYGLDDVRSGLAGKTPVAPVVFLTCSSGEFDGKLPCMAEVMLATPGGPPVVIAATTESHPLTNLFTGRALLTRLGTGGSRIGDVWLDGQRKAAGMRDFVMEKMLSDVEGKLEDEIDQAKLRRDQPLLYAILGDPAVKLKMPAALDVSIERMDTGWSYTVEEPEGATLLVVGRRQLPKRGRREAGAAPDNPEQAADLLAAANAREQYATVREAGAGDNWAGELTEPGWYRFVVATPTGLLVAAVELR